MNRHAGILRWLRDRRRRELRSAVVAKGAARQHAHRVLAEQIGSAMVDLERAGASETDRGTGDAGGARAGVRRGEDTGEEESS